MAEVDVNIDGFGYPSEPVNPIKPLCPTKPVNNGFFGDNSKILFFILVFLILFYSCRD